MPKLYSRFTRLAPKTLCLLLLSLPFGWSPAHADGFDHTHHQFTQLLSQVVTDNKVNYRALRADPSRLDAYLQALAAPSRAEFERWSREQQIAYWINAYNASVLKAIVNAYPIKRKGFKGLVFPSNSIWQIPGVWKKLTQPLVGGEAHSLDQIEHDILRPQYNEPRIHFAVVCASIGCPPLRSEAFAAKRLDEQLRDQAKQFLSDRTHGAVIDEKQLRVSRIFKWFGEDFTQYAPQHCKSGRRKPAGVVAFVAQFVGNKVLEDYCDGRVRLKYLDYDWHLNDGSDSA